jgi:hypothetical protein
MNKQYIVSGKIMIWDMGCKKGFRFQCSGFRDRIHGTNKTQIAHRRSHITQNGGGILCWKKSVKVSWQAWAPCY